MAHFSQASKTGRGCSHAAQHSLDSSNSLSRQVPTNSPVHVSLVGPADAAHVEPSLPDELCVGGRHSRRPPDDNASGEDLLRKRLGHNGGVADVEPVDVVHEDDLDGGMNKTKGQSNHP